MIMITVGSDQMSASAGYMHGQFCPFKEGLFR